MPQFLPLQEQNKLQEFPDGTGKYQQDVKIQNQFAENRQRQSSCAYFLKGVKPLPVV